jgi:predicted nuclease of predicted toxin-antitoxin system
MAQFYADENFPQPVVEALRELGHDVLTMSESGRGEQKIPDEQVLAIAAEYNRVLLTLNRKHFIRLHGEKSSHAGMIVCTFDADFIGQAQRIHSAVIQLKDLAGQLLRVYRPLQ